VDPVELEQLIVMDATLAYRLLRYMNSAFFGLSSTIDSIQHTVTMMGPAALRQWASLILMVRLADEKPPELLVTGLIRAKMCELIGGADVKTAADRYFTVGLFSVLDALLDMPLREVLATLPLASDVKSALTDYSGVLGRTLKHVLDYERGQAGPLDDLPAALCKDAYLSALRWSRDSQQALQS
jgi:EAL and modified HD-GYP domain-containing signal transduction protein